MTDRKIKFRVWDKEEKRMYTPDEIGVYLRGDGKLVSLWSKYYNVPEVHEEVYDDLVPLLFIGLTDAVGKEIYEGDITENQFGDRFEVKWDILSEDTETIGHGLVASSLSVGFYVGAAYGSLKDLHLRVVGNIYENPELLDESVPAS